LAFVGVFLFALSIPFSVPYFFPPQWFRLALLFPYKILSKPCSPGVLFFPSFQASHLVSSCAVPTCSEILRFRFSSLYFAAYATQPSLPSESDPPGCGFWGFLFFLFFCCFWGWVGWWFFGVFCGFFCGFLGGVSLSCFFFFFGLCFLWRVVSPASLPSLLSNRCLCFPFIFSR